MVIRRIGSGLNSWGKSSALAKREEEEHNIMHKSKVAPLVMDTVKKEKSLRLCLLSENLGKCVSGK